MRTIKSLFSVMSFLALMSTASALTLQKGVHYDIIDPPQPTEVAGKIEVIEFFSYGCPHCYHMEPSINPWIKKLPKDVNFFRVPLAGGSWVACAKLFYTLDALDVEDKLHSDVFAAIHSEKSLTGTDESAMSGWAAKNGLDEKKFTDIYKSFAIQTKVQRAVQMIASHKVSGVPAIVVDGRYLVLNNTIKSYDDLLAITDQVIEMARASKK
jgi:protein dithiol oxidoreductase (disulfide-forming)